MEGRCPENNMEVQKELCMKVLFERDPKILRVFENLPPIFRIERNGENVCVYCPIGLHIDMEECGLSFREFYRVYKAIRVEGGRKIWKGGRIELRPTADVVVSVRLAESELELVKIAAERAGETLQHYARKAVLGRMLRELGV